MLSVRSASNAKMSTFAEMTLSTASNWSLRTKSSYMVKRTVQLGDAKCAKTTSIWKGSKSASSTCWTGVWSLTRCKTWSAWTARWSTTLWWAHVATVQVSLSRRSGTCALRSWQILTCWTRWLTFASSSDCSVTLAVSIRWGYCKTLLRKLCFSCKSSDDELSIKAKRKL